MTTKHKSQSQLDIAETAQTNKKYGEEIMKLTDIPNSPFKHVKQDEKEFIVLGSQIIHECNFNQALKLVKDKDWKILINTIATIADKVHKTNKNG